MLGRLRFTFFTLVVLHFSIASYAQSKEPNLLSSASAWHMTMERTARRADAGAVLRNAALVASGTIAPQADANAGAQATPVVTRHNPPVLGFYGKTLDVGGIRVKAHISVEDSALIEAKRRIELVLSRIPVVRQNLAEAGVDFDIIGKDQNMNDLPETAQAAKGTVLPDGRHFDDLRALGGWHPCAGVEQFENHLPTPSFNGYDIPIHEFAHCIYEYGCDQAFRNSVLQQYEKSLKNNKWVGSYAGRSNGEFFAEMTTWYFGAHGDLTMTGPKPANGPDGLKAYDPDTYRFIDDFYSGRTRIPRFTWTELTPSTTPPNADDAKSFVEVSAIRVTNLSGRRIAIWRVRPQRVDKIIGELDPNEQRAVIIGPFAKIVILPMGQTPAKDAKWFYSSTVLRGSVIYR